MIEPKIQQRLLGKKMLKFYSGTFEKWSLHIRDSFMQIRNNELNHIITLHYDTGKYPKFEINDDAEETIIFKTPTYQLQVVFEYNDIITLQLLDNGEKELLYMSGIPTILAEGLKEIGQGRSPTHGKVMSYDPFAFREEDSDSGYSSGDSATFSDTYY